MAGLRALISDLGDEVDDVDEDLGMPNPKSDEVDLTISGRDFTVKQSPGLLQSDRAGGTTGAAVWQTSLRVAEWLGASCPLFARKVLTSDSSVIELGSGVSGIVPLVLSDNVATILATDQPYALKLLRENIQSNTMARHASVARRKQAISRSLPSNIEVHALDWETDDVASLLRSCGHPLGVDAVIACDCIYNSALAFAFVQTCVDVCSIRNGTEPSDAPTVCVIAQHLRQADVFEEWLRCFSRAFRVWRVPDDLLTQGLKQDSGFAVHVGILR